MSLIAMSFYRTKTLGILNFQPRNSCTGHLLLKVAVLKFKKYNKLRKYIYQKAYS